MALKRVTDGSRENRFQYPERHQCVTGLQDLWIVADPVFMKLNNAFLIPQLGDGKMLEVYNSHWNVTLCTQ
jgi:hypothetical protein